MAIKKNIFRVRNLIGADSSGSKGVMTRPLSTIAKSHEGAVALVDGLNRLPEWNGQLEGAFPQKPRQWEHGKPKMATT